MALPSCSGQISSLGDTGLASPYLSAERCFKYLHLHLQRLADSLIQRTVHQNGSLYTIMIYKLLTMDLVYHHRL